MIKFLNRHKSKIFAVLACVLVVSCSFVLICSAELESADDLERYSYEVGRTVNCSFNLNSWDSINGNYFINGLLANGNNFTYYYDYIEYYDVFVDDVNLFGSWGYEYEDIYSTFNIYSSVRDASVELDNTISYTLSDFYIYALNNFDDEPDILDDIYFNFIQEIYDTSSFSGATIRYEICYYDLLDLNLYGEIEPIFVQNEFSFLDYATVSENLAYSQYRIYDFIGDVGESLFYFDYFTVTFDTGAIETDSDFLHSAGYSLSLYDEVAFDYNGTSYTLTTQSDFDSFRIHQFASAQPVQDTIPSEYFRSYTDWLATAVSGFFSFELFPGFYLGGVLVAVIAFSLVMWWLKMFGGG